MMRSIHLHGRLKKEFGASYRFEVETAAEAIRALNCAFPRRFIAELERGSYKLVRGDKRSGMQLDLDLVTGLKLGMADLHIMPVAKGSSNKGTGTTKLVLGTALVGAALFFSGGTLATPIASTGILSGTSYGSIALVGVGLALSGAATLMSKTADTATQASDSAQVSGGNIGNSGGQGNCIPLIYGEMVVGSTPVNVYSDVEDIGVYADARGSIEAAFGNIFKIPASELS
jgi:predicted phage tail protein